MTHVIELTDEQYAAIERGAQEQGVSPQAYLRLLAESVRLPRTVYDDLDEMFHALGMTEDQIAESDRMADAWFPPDEGSETDEAREQSALGGAPWFLGTDVGVLGVS